MHDVWADLTDEQRRKVHNKFFRFRPKVGVIESTDGYLTVLAKKTKKNLPDKEVRNRIRPQQITSVLSRNTHLGVITPFSSNF